MCTALEIDDPLLARPGRMDRLEVHRREAHQAAERVHTRRPESREMVVEEDVRPLDLVLDASEVGEPFLHLRCAVDLDPAELLQRTIPDEPQVHEVRRDDGGRLRVHHLRPRHRHLELPQFLEYGLVEPGAVAELHRVPEVLREAPQEIEQLLLPADHRVRRGEELFDFLRSLPKRSEEHTSELQSESNLVCRLLLEKKKINETAHDRTRRTSKHRRSTTSISNMIQTPELSPPWRPFS